ncbi:MAG TPA: GNAT family N-acetyltransferase [Eudoraea sp.]|nr:GNAT family N-acetyltransferase [Eudoraea sp.]
MLRYRTATKEDTDSIAVLHAKNWKLNYRGILNDQYLDHEVTEDRQKVWKARLEHYNPNMYLILAEEAGELVGFGCLFLEDDERYGALLDNLHVGHLHSGKGIGGKLMALLAKEILRRAGRRDMYLWVLRDNIAAIRFYERLHAQRKEQHTETELWEHPVEKIRYYWPTVAILVSDRNS